MKLIFQITAGILLAGALAFGGIRYHGWYITRSTAASTELQLAHDLMDIGVKVCAVSHDTNSCLYDLLGSCRKFHINDADCKELMGNAVKNYSKSLTKPSP